MYTPSQVVYCFAGKSSRIGIQSILCEYSYKLSGLLLIENPKRKEKDS